LSVYRNVEVENLGFRNESGCIESGKRGLDQENRREGVTAIFLNAPIHGKTRYRKEGKRMVGEGDEKYLSQGKRETGRGALWGRTSGGGIRKKNGPK